MLLLDRRGQRLVGGPSRGRRRERLFQFRRDDQILDRVRQRPRSVGFGGIDHGLSPLVHEPCGDEPFDTPFVDPRPLRALPSRGVTLNQPVLVDSLGEAVDPAETQRLFYQVFVCGTVDRRGEFAVHHPHTFVAGGVRLQPSSPIGPRDGDEHFLAVGRRRLGEVGDGRHVATIRDGPALSRGVVSPVWSRSTTCAGRRCHSLAVTRRWWQAGGSAGSAGSSTWQHRATRPCWDSPFRKRSGRRSSRRNRTSSCCPSLPTCDTTGRSSASRRSTSKSWPRSCSTRGGWWCRNPSPDRWPPSGTSSSTTGSRLVEAPAGRASRGRISSPLGVSGRRPVAHMGERAASVLRFRAGWLGIETTGVRREPTMSTYYQFHRPMD